MKSYEEFADTDLNDAIFTRGGNAVYEVVKARDLEMWKQGMTDAAGMLDDRDDYGMAATIIAARNNAKSVAEIGSI